MTVLLKAPEETATQCDGRWMWCSRRGNGAELLALQKRKVGFGSS